MWALILLCDIDVDREVAKRIRLCSVRGNGIVPVLSQNDRNKFTQEAYFFSVAGATDFCMRYDARALSWSKSVGIIG